MQKNTKKEKNNYKSHLKELSIISIWKQISIFLGTYTNKNIGRLRT